MFKKRTVILAFVLSPVVGICSIIPYVLTQGGYEVNGSLLALGWITLMTSALAFGYSFMSAVASIMMWGVISLPGGIELLIKANNPYRMFAWKEACESYEQIAHQHRESSREGSSKGI